MGRLIQLHAPSQSSGMQFCTCSADGSGAAELRACFLESAWSLTAPGLGLRADQAVSRASGEVLVPNWDRSGIIPSQIETESRCGTQIIISWTGN